MNTPATASQTVGPFFSIGMSALYNDRLFEPALGDELLTVSGQVFDGAGAPIFDAVFELWQADSAGQYVVEPSGPPAQRPGFARVPTDASGAFRFATVKPGCVAAADGRLQAPHINVCLFMRGLLRPVRTRLYFPGDRGHTEDPVLARVPPARRATLIAQASGPGTLHWDVHMQGDAETVFFEF